MQVFLIYQQLLVADIPFVLNFIFDYHPLGKEMSKSNFENQVSIKTHKDNLLKTKVNTFKTYCVFF